MVWLYITCDVETGQDVIRFIGGMLELLTSVFSEHPDYEMPDLSTFSLKVSLYVSPSSLFVLSRGSES